MILSSLDNAIIEAVHAHAGQVDKSGEPYILHPLRVMTSPKLYNEKLRIIAVLHDVVEDTITNLNKIFYMFGEEVATAIDAISHRKYEPQLAYLTRVCANELALTVKLADIKDNRSRIKNLDADTKIRLARKYSNALDIIEEIELKKYVDSNKH